MTQITRTTDPNEDPLNPPEDFGAALAAEFERRAAHTEPAEPVDNGPESQDLGDSATESPDLAPPQGSDLDVGGDSAGLTPDVTQDDGTPTGTTDTPDTADTQTDAPQAIDTSTDASGETPTDTTDTPAATDDADDGTPTEPEPYPGYIWVEGDQRVEFSERDVREGLTLVAWARGLPPDARESYANLEAGTHRAVPVAEYEAFANWQANRDSPLATDDDPFADPIERELAQLRAEVAQLRTGGDPQATTQSTPQSYAQQPGAQYSPLNAASGGPNDATVAIMDQALETYAETHGLTVEQRDDLLSRAVNMNIIPAISDSLAVRNPVTGQILSYGDPAEVISTAMDVALARTPELYNQTHTPKVNSPEGNPAQVTPTNDQLSAPLEAEAADALALKKARAGSVASAPASPVPQTAPSVTSMSPDERREAMAKDLAAVMSVGQ